MPQNPVSILAMQFWFGRVENDALPVTTNVLGSFCSVFLKCVLFKKTLMCEKWFAESYVKVYADFHESKVVLVMSHGQKYFVFHVKRHHVDANP